MSGSVADILQAYPSITPDQVKAILMKSASKTFPQYSTTVDPLTGISYVSQYDVFTIGAGYLDLEAALNMASTPPPSGATMISPTASYDSNSGNVYFVADSSSLWGNSAMPRLPQQKRVKSPPQKVNAMCRTVRMAGTIATTHNSRRRKPVK